MEEQCDDDDGGGCLSVGEMSTIPSHPRCNGWLFLYTAILGSMLGMWVDACLCLCTDDGGIYWRDSSAQTTEYEEKPTLIWTGQCSIRVTSTESLRATHP